MTKPAIFLFLRNRQKWVVQLWSVIQVGTFSQCTCQLASHLEREAMDELKKVRWEQRFSNLQKAFQQLQTGLAIKVPSTVEVQGVIKSFEFTFELAWKTLKDYLEAQGVPCQFPRETLKQSFHYEILQNAEIWLEMLSKRNLLAHTYDEQLASEAYRLISIEYFGHIQDLLAWFAGRIDE
jgi:nucleotidyltransferase substrate binding protein (TIGR01987 family)